MSFALGLLVAGLATSMWVLVVARAVQGFGAGLNIVSLYVVVARAFPAGLRPRVFSAISSGWILPSLVGPPVAGLLADHVSWRWVFLGVLPLLLGAALLVRPHLARTGRPGRGRAAERRDAAASAPRCWPRSEPGCCSSAASCSSGHPAPAAACWSWPGWCCSGVGVPRLLPAGAFRLGRGLPTVVVLRGVLAGAFFGAETFIPLMLVEQRSLATTLAGASLTGAALTWSLGAWLQGRPGLRTPRCGAGDARLRPRARRHRAGRGGHQRRGAGRRPRPSAGWWPGSGMGLGLTSLSVLVLELSPVAEQGANAVRAAGQRRARVDRHDRHRRRGLRGAGHRDSRTAPRRTSSSTR